LEPASYITQDSSSELFIPLSATFIWTCRFNLLHTAITFHHFFTVSRWAHNLPFQKILSSTLVCFCLSDWSHGSRLFAVLICSSILCFSSILFDLVIPKSGRLSWPSLWSTFRRNIKYLIWLIEFYYCCVLHLAVHSLYVRGAAKKVTPKIFFAFFSAIAWNFKAKFYRRI